MAKALPGEACWGAALAPTSLAECELGRMCAQQGTLGQLPGGLRGTGRWPWGDVRTADVSAVLRRLAMHKVKDRRDEACPGGLWPGPLEGPCLPTLRQSVLRGLGAEGCPAQLRSHRLTLLPGPPVGHCPYSHRSPCQQQQLEENLVSLWPVPGSGTKPTLTASLHPAPCWLQAVKVLEGP